MKYEDFRKKVAGFPFFRSNIFTHLTDNPSLLRRQMVDWVKRGYVIPLKRGMYTLRDSDRETKFSLFYLANQLYSPSYISLESALSYYGFIPEGVYAVTSVTTKKTQSFENELGHFIYRNIQSSRFDGFTTVLDEFENSYNIASKERALIDFLFFHCKGLRDITEDIFTESFRFQNLESVDKKALRRTAESFDNVKLTKIVKLLIQHIEQLK